MIVHYVSSSTIPSTAANTVHVMKMCAAMTRLGHTVVLFGRGSSFEEKTFAGFGVVDRFEVHLANHRDIAVLGSWMTAYAHRRAIKGIGRPDLLWGRDLQSLLALRNEGARIVYESHAPPPSQYHRRLERLLMRMKTFSNLVVVSDALAAEYLRIHPRLDPGRVVVARDAADPIGLDVAPMAELPSRQGAPRVGYAGHLYRGRGISLIFEVADACQEVDFHLVGGTDSDVKAWRAKVRQRGLGNVYLHGYKPHTQVASFLRSCDILLAPYEPSVAVAGGGDTGRWMSPLKIFEYMASGRPMIVSRLPVLEEVITPGHEGLLCDPGNAAEWVSAIRRLLGDASLRRQLGSRARERFESEFTWDRRAAKVLSSVAP